MPDLMEAMLDPKIAIPKAGAELRLGAIAYGLRRCNRALSMPSMFWRVRTRSNGRCPGTAGRPADDPRTCGRQPVDADHRTG